MPGGGGVAQQREARRDASFCPCRESSQRSAASLSARRRPRTRGFLGGTFFAPLPPGRFRARSHSQFVARNARYPSGHPCPPDGKSAIPLHESLHIKVGNARRNRHSSSPHIVPPDLEESIAFTYLFHQAAAHLRNYASPCRIARMEFFARDNDLEAATKLLRNHLSFYERNVSP